MSSSKQKPNVEEDLKQKKVNFDWLKKNNMDIADLVKMSRQQKGLEDDDSDEYYEEIIEEEVVEDDLSLLRKPSSNFHIPKFSPASSSKAKPAPAPAPKPAFVPPKIPIQQANKKKKKKEIDGSKLLLLQSAEQKITGASDAFKEALQEGVAIISLLEFMLSNTEDWDEDQIEEVDPKDWETRTNLKATIDEATSIINRLEAAKHALMGTRNKGDPAPAHTEHQQQRSPSPLTTTVSPKASSPNNSPSSIIRPNLVVHREPSFRVPDLATLTEEDDEDVAAMDNSSKVFESSRRQLSESSTATVKTGNNSNNSSAKTPSNSNNANLDKAKNELLQFAKEGAALASKLEKKNATPTKIPTLVGAATTEIVEEIIVEEDEDELTKAKNSMLQFAKEGTAMASKLGQKSAANKPTEPAAAIDKSSVAEEAGSKAQVNQEIEDAKRMFLEAAKQGASLVSALESKINRRTSAAAVMQNTKSKDSDADTVGLNQSDVQQARKSFVALAQQGADLVAKLEDKLKIEEESSTIADDNKEDDNKEEKGAVKRSSEASVASIKEDICEASDSFLEKAKEGAALVAKLETQLEELPAGKDFEKSKESPDLALARKTFVESATAASDKAHSTLADGSGVNDGSMKIQQPESETDTEGKENSESGKADEIAGNNEKPSTGVASEVKDGNTSDENTPSEHVADEKTWTTKSDTSKESDTVASDTPVEQREKASSDADVAEMNEETKSEKSPEPEETSADKSAVAEEKAADFSAVDKKTAPEKSGEKAEETTKDDPGKTTSSDVSTEGKTAASDAAPENTEDLPEEPAHKETVKEEEERMPVQLGEEPKNKVVKASNDSTSNDSEQSNAEDAKRPVNGGPATDEQDEKSGRADEAEVSKDNPAAETSKPSDEKEEDSGKWEAIKPENAADGAKADLSSEVVTSEKEASKDEANEESTANSGEKDAAADQAETIDKTEIDNDDNNSTKDVPAPEAKAKAPESEDGEEGGPSVRVSTSDISALKASITKDSFDDDDDDDEEEEDNEDEIDDKEAKDDNEKSKDEAVSSEAGENSTYSSSQTAKEAEKKSKAEVSEEKQSGTSAETDELTKSKSNSDEGSKANGEVSNKDIERARKSFIAAAQVGDSMISKLEKEFCDDSSKDNGYTTTTETETDEKTSKAELLVKARESLLVAAEEGDMLASLMQKSPRKAGANSDVVSEMEQDQMDVSSASQRFKDAVKLIQRVDSKSSQTMDESEYEEEEIEEDVNAAKAAFLQFAKEGASLVSKLESKFAKPNEENEYEEEVIEEDDDEEEEVLDKADFLKAAKDEFLSFQKNLDKKLPKTDKSNADEGTKKEEKKEDESSAAAERDGEDTDDKDDEDDDDPQEIKRSGSIVVDS